MKTIQPVAPLISKYNKLMSMFIVFTFTVFMLIALMFYHSAHAMTDINIQSGTTNPCEYMNVNAEKMHQLDTGNDENFRRIVQENNQALVRACQEYEIKLLNTVKSDLNRDNY